MSGFAAPPTNLSRSMTAVLAGLGIACGTGNDYTGDDCAASTRAIFAAKRLCPLQQRQLDVVVGGTVGDRDADALAWIDHKLGRVS